MRFERFGKAAILGMIFSAVCASAPGVAAQERDRSAAGSIDLSKLDLLEPIGTTVRNRAELSYTSGSTVAAAYASLEKQLKAREFVPKAGAAVTEQYASGVFQFQDKGDRIAVMIFPGGDKGVTVTVSNQGAVELAKLPVPAGAKELFSGPSSIQYVTGKTVDETRESVSVSLTADGWQQYGEAGPILSFKKGPLQLRTMIVAAPGQGGKTVFDYQTQMMSADIDAPSGATRIAYAESTKSLDVDTNRNLDATAEDYAKILAAKGWKPTTEKPIQDNFEYFWIFRNERKEMLDLKIRKIGEGTRILAKFMTAGEVEEESRKAEIAARKAMSKTKADRFLRIEPPSDGIETWNVSDRRIEAVTRMGEARKAAESIRNDLKKAGWEITAEVVENIAGSIAMTQGELSVSIVYDDTGITPAELTISLTGAKFETPRPGK